jgi:hypothetical protein
MLTLSLTLLVAIPIILFIYEEKSTFNSSYLASMSWLEIPIPSFFVVQLFTSSQTREDDSGGFGSIIPLSSSPSILVGVSFTFVLSSLLHTSSMTYLLALLCLMRLYSFSHCQRLLWSSCEKLFIGVFSYHKISSSLSLRWSRNLTNNFIV